MNHSLQYNYVHCELSYISGVMSQEFAGGIALFLMDIYDNVFDLYSLDLIPTVPLMGMI